MKYNHMFDIAFTVESKESDYKDVNLEELIKGLIITLPSLYEDGLERFGFSDTIELEESE